MFLVIFIKIGGQVITDLKSMGHNDQIADDKIAHDKYVNKSA